MKTYIVYVNGVEVNEMIKAAGHNAAEKKAKRIYGPSEERIRTYLAVNPWMGRESAIANLTSGISVVYTEI